MTTAYQMWTFQETVSYSSAPYAIYKSTSRLSDSLRPVEGKRWQPLTVVQQPKSWTIDDCEWEQDDRHCCLPPPTCYLWWVLQSVIWGRLGRGTTSGNAVVPFFPSPSTTHAQKLQLHKVSQWWPFDSVSSLSICPGEYNSISWLTSFTCLTYLFFNWLLEATAYSIVFYPCATTMHTPASTCSHLCLPQWWYLQRK